jgi:excisionase family DNA binding protein
MRKRKNDSSVPDLPLPERRRRATSPLHGAPEAASAPAAPATPAPIVTPIVVDRVLSPPQLADLLQVSPVTIARLFRAGKLPHLRVGNQIRFRSAEVLAALAAQRKK